MRIAVHFNPLSGKGRAAALARDVAGAASAAGHTVVLLPTRSGHPLTKAEIEGIDVLAVAGGDGTIHWTLDALCDAPTAVYHVPSGTENLFAREFGTTARPGQFVEWVDANRVVRVDLGSCNAVLFSLMCSFGPDAGIIHRLGNARKGPITTASYLKPVLSELIDPRIPRLSIWSQGRPVVIRERGMLIVGNSRHYAWGLNPARTAEIDDGLLDFAFFPADTVADVLVWAVRLGATWDRCQTRHRALPTGVIHFQSSAARIQSHQADCLCQMDGEQKVIPSSGDLFDFRVLEGSLRVLGPSNR
ncbi:MAG: diacylglycerol kinase family protein [Planctomycetota bacterium]